MNKYKTNADNHNQQNRKKEKKRKFCNDTSKQDQTKPQTTKLLKVDPDLQKNDIKPLKNWRSG